MDMRIEPHPLAGTIAAIPSKSVAHRLLVLSALCDGITDLTLSASSQDIDATARCVTALGASVARTRTGLRVVPVTVAGVRREARLDAGESGSTLRFLLPVVAALGKGARIRCHGRLARRPLAPLDQQLAEHGVDLRWEDDSTLVVSGPLRPGRFDVPGDVSSQFVSGLLMAAPAMGGAVEVWVGEPVESAGYIDLTIDALRTFGVSVETSRELSGGQAMRVYAVAGDARLRSPGSCTVEGDWSNSAFWLAAAAMGPHPIAVTGLNQLSRQGDRSVMAALALMGARIGRASDGVLASRDTPHAHDIDVSGIPDLAVPLAAVAALAPGVTRLRNASRLRLKESDRLASICDALCALGGKAHVEDDDLLVEGVEALSGGTVDAAGDHRIAMMAAICATGATDPVVIRGAECVAKSYPTFFDDFRALGGIAREER